MEAGGPLFELMELLVQDHPRDRRVWRGKNVGGHRTAPNAVRSGPYHEIFHPCRYERNSFVKLIQQTTVGDARGASSSFSSYPRPGARASSSATRSTWPG